MAFIDITCSSCVKETLISAQFPKFNYNEIIPSNAVTETTKANNK